MGLRPRHREREGDAGGAFSEWDQQQQQGVPPIIMQQVHPASMQAVMQSQQPWIILQQSASPLVQVTQQPSFIISHLHMPIVMLQQHTIMPFIMQQQLTMPPAIILQRFCIMAQAAMSVQVQVIFMPPAHFSNFMVQRGTVTIPGAIVLDGIPMPVVGAVVVAGVIGFIIAVTMRSSCASCDFESFWASVASTREILTCLGNSAITTELL